MSKISPKPSWLNKKVDIRDCRRVRSLLKKLNLHTVCEEALCPNISECFGSGLATFMILGDICTRNCSFCGVKKEKPAKVDVNEPKRIKQAVKNLGLDYIVITSPTRDDLVDGGANIFVEAVSQVKSLGLEKKVEILIPDFWGKRELLRKIASCGAEVIAHNIETIPSLYPRVRNGADYERSLKVLEIVKEENSDILTKSGLMLGLGEKKEEVIKALEDLLRVGCDFLTLGQYLPPSLAHYPLKEYISPDKFKILEDFALKIGFKKVKSSPYVRSSYLAHTFLPNKG
jgi:lipoic acid synthetase